MGTVGRCKACRGGAIRDAANPTAQRELYVVCMSGNQLFFPNKPNSSDLEFTVEITASDSVLPERDGRVELNQNRRFQS